MILDTPHLCSSKDLLLILLFRHRLIKPIGIVDINFLDTAGTQLGNESDDIAVAMPVDSGGVLASDTEVRNVNVISR